MAMLASLRGRMRDTITSKELKRMQYWPGLLDG